MYLLSVFMKTEFAYGTVPEKLSLCGQMILTGLGTVFIVLLVLWGIISIFGLIAKSSNKQVPVKTVQDTPTANAVEKTIDHNDDLIAVIMASIEAYRLSEGKTGSYRVVSFRRNSGRKSWNKNNEE